MNTTTDTVSMPAQPDRRRFSAVWRVSRTLLRSRPLLLLLFISVLCATMTFYYPTSFASASNAKAVLLNASLYAILVVGMMILMVGGAFDLSIGGIFGLAGVVAGVLIAEHGAPVWAGVLAAIAVGGAAGLANGLIVTRIGVNALITTLATLGILQGITQLISGTGVAPIDDGFAKLGQSVWLGLQSPFWFALVLVVLGSWAVSQTRYFRQYYYVGANERAAELSGIKPRRLVLLSFVLMGLLAGLAGMLNAARLDAANVTAGGGLELQVITAAVLGGASLKGGEGTVIGGVLGVLFIALVQNSLIIIDIDVFWQNIVVGLVLLFAVSLDQLNRRERVHRAALAPTSVAPDHKEEKS